MSHTFHVRPACSRARAALVLVVACALLAFGSPAVRADGAEQAAQSSLDAEFVRLREAFAAGDRARVERLAPRFRDHLLEPYAQHWALRVRLDDAEPAAIEAFLSSQSGTPPAEVLRTEWLKVLGKQQRWDLFAAQLPQARSPDPEITCYALQMRRAAQTTESARAAVLEEARGLWFNGRETPESCNPLFAALVDSRKLSSADLWARFRLAAEEGSTRLAARVNGMLPAKEQIPAASLERASRDPVGQLSKVRLRPATRAGQELALYTLHRALRSDPDAAALAWTRVRRELPAPDAKYGNAFVGLAFARRHHPEALAWFREGAVPPDHDEMLAWHARAALREQAWRELASVIDAMGPEARGEAAWRYWKARALRETGRGEEAKPALAQLAGEHHFYGLLAAEELGLTFTLASRPVDPSAEELESFAARLGVRRALALYRLDARPEANREWLYAIRGFDDRQLLVAAEVARRNGIWDRAINTAERTTAQHDFALRFLAPYRAELASAARHNEIDEALVLGLVRQESRFMADIVSSAGARGLMQLMPATARWVAKQLGRGDFKPSQIIDVETNAAFGTFYFKYWLERLDGLPVLAAAAYNAGPGRAQAWRPRRAIEGAIYAETIPFNETRDYVKKVLANAYFYAYELGLPQTSLRERLGTVTPRGETVASSSLGQ